MLDRPPSPELFYFFKRQFLTHHLCKSRILVDRLRFAENIGKTVRIDVEGNVFHVGARR